jgi:hypothetical protein
VAQPVAKVIVLLKIKNPFIALSQDTFILHGFSAISA